MLREYRKSDSQEQNDAQTRLRSLLVAAAILLSLLLAVYACFFLDTRKSDQLILTHQYSTVIKKLQKWRWLPLVNGGVYEKIGTAELLKNGQESASLYFRVAENKSFSRPVSVWLNVLDVLWKNGRYRDGLFYADHISKKLPDAKVIHFYKAGFFGGQNELERASQELTAAGPLPQLAEEMTALREEIGRRSATGEYNLVYDRKNLPLARISIAGKPTILYEPVRSVLQTPAADSISKLAAHPNTQAAITIDYRIQSAALKALGKYAGAIVLLDVQTGEILAGASNSKGVRSAHPPDTPLAMNGLYEPGSIIKMITLAGALEKNTNVQAMFPMECSGLLKLTDQGMLYCWKAHGTLKDWDAATAVSCNVAFGKMGLEMKAEKLLANLHEFGFDSQLQDPFLPIKLGTIKKSDLKDTYLTNLSIGLEYLQMTPLHAAMVASAIANDGVSMRPRLLRNYRNIIGFPFGAPASVIFRKFMSKQTARVVTKAMEHVIHHPEGTGRRAAIDKFPFAMKTGTAGEGAKGYNALLIGFGPLPRPKVAFSIFVEHCGKAEFEGARITKLFLESIQGYI